MQKALLLSIQSTPSYYIVRGEKLWEVRTRKLPQGIDIYGYVTKGRPLLTRYDSQVIFDGKWIDYMGYQVLNGTVPFKFRVGEIIEVPYEVIIPEGYNDYDGEWVDNSKYGYWASQSLLDNSKLTYEELEAYGKGKKLYFHEITNLQIFDKPMALGEFYKEEYAVMPNGVFPAYQPLTKAPQKYQFVWVRE